MSSSCLSVNNTIKFNTTYIKCHNLTLTTTTTSNGNNRNLYTRKIKSQSSSPVSSKCASPTPMLNENNSTILTRVTSRSLSPLALTTIDLNRLSTENTDTPVVASNNVTNSNTVLSLGSNSNTCLINLNDERLNLIEKLNENHKVILSARNEYLKEYKNFIKIVYKFYDEKYLNLKLKFKNQILKQQIYFESELFDLSKECRRDYNEHIKTLKLNDGDESSRCNKKIKLTIKTIADKYIRLYKIDMKKLIDYMKDALLNSYDTLIEAYETCHILKLIEKILKQNTSTFVKLINDNKNSMKSIEQYLTSTNETSNEAINYELGEIHALFSGCEMGQNDKQEEQQDDNTNRNASDNDDDCDPESRIEEQMQIVKYKQEMENLMHILDDIEVQYLHRKDEMQKKSKFFYKLKSQIKSVESKYEMLSKEVNNLKYESYLYKELLNEKYLVLGNKEKLNLNYTSPPSPPTTPPSETMPLIESQSTPPSSPTTTLVGASMQISNGDEKSFENQNDDYNRKLYLIKNLISLHKVKNNSNNSNNNSNNSNNNGSSNNNNNNTNSLVNCNLNVKRSSINSEYPTLHIYESTLDGDLVTIENSNLKFDFNLSNWLITRQIDNMPELTYKIPENSVCKCGKLLTLKTLFNDQLDFLYAIKQTIDSTTVKKTNSYGSGGDSLMNYYSIKITTRLISPDGKLASIHAQEIPQYYKDIFKYANLIEFFN